MALYPPIIASSLPAFGITGTNSNIPILFGLSKYNSASEISSIQISIRQHNSNVNVVNGKDLVVVPFSDVEQNDITKLYHLDIQSEGNFILKPNILYRIQLRFSSLPYNAIHIDPAKCSEWSTVCIIKPIIAPKFYLKEFETGSLSGLITEISNNLDLVTADFTGIYEPGDSKLILYRWRLRLLDPDFDETNLANIDDYTIIDSDWNFVSAYNYIDGTNKIIFNCNLNYEFPDPDSEEGFSEYKLYFLILTRNGYKASKIELFELNYFADEQSKLHGDFLVAVNEEEGFIKLRYTESTDTLMTSYVLRRTSSTSNFLYWQDLHYFQYGANLSTLPFEYIDYTVESGIIYKYGLQTVNSYGRRGRLKTSQECMGEWLHAFLLEGCGNNARQLKLKYDFDISSYKTNVSLSKIDTLGGRYPFIRRNGNMYYRSFPITGIITALMDDLDRFTDNSELYGTQKISSAIAPHKDFTNEDFYEEFFGPYDNYVTRYNYTHERKFRERVEEFLYNTKVKLYKSMQEGNILVKLMEVSLTPKKELGRLIYTFSATAYLIANVHLVYWHSNVRGTPPHNLSNIGAGVFSDSNINIIQTLSDNGFLDIGTYATDIYSWDSDWKIGQISYYAGEGVNGDIVSAIKQKYKIGYEFLDLSTQTFNSEMLISNIHIEIDQPPQLYSDVNGKYIGTFFEEKESEDKQILGTFVHFNGNTILIAPPGNIYDIYDDSATFLLNDLSFIIDSYNNQFQGTIDFLYKIKTSKDTANLVYKTVNKRIIGGLDYHDIQLDVNLLNLIKYKHTQKTYIDGLDKISQRISDIENIIVEAEPGSVVTIRTKVGENVTSSDITINETGVLHLQTADELHKTAITYLAFKSEYNTRNPEALVYYTITGVKEYRKAVIE